MMCSNERAIARIQLGATLEPEVLRDDPNGVDAARLSPDGRYIAYLSWESGDGIRELASYPNMTGRRRIAEHVTDIRWKQDGSEIYYLLRNPDRMVAAQLAPGDAFVIVSTEVLFDVEALGIQPYSKFDVSADGEEFVFVRGEPGAGAPKQFTVVENWYEEFREQGER